jgi:flagellar motility protein MotE (MotC chaperone)
MEELANKYGLELSTSQTADILNTQGSHNDDGVSVFTSGTVGTSSTIQITDEDLDAFERSVASKRDKLKEQLNEHRNQSEKAEDSIQSELAELSGKIKAIENGKFPHWRC